MSILLPLGADDVVGHVCDEAGAQRLFNRGEARHQGRSYLEKGQRPLFFLYGVPHKSFMGCDHIGSRVAPGRLKEGAVPGRGSGGQTQMGEDLGSHRGIFDGGDECELFLKLSGLNIQGRKLFG